MQNLDFSPMFKRKTKSFSKLILYIIDYAAEDVIMTKKLFSTYDTERRKDMKIKVEEICEEMLLLNEETKNWYKESFKNYEESASLPLEFVQAKLDEYRGKQGNKSQMKVLFYRSIKRNA